MDADGRKSAERNLAIGHDENLGRAIRRVGSSGQRDRLLHVGDHATGSGTSLWSRRRAGCGRAAELDRLLAGSRECNLTLTTDKGTQFNSERFLKTLGQLGITHRRTAYHLRATATSERFHRNLKEQEVWIAEYRALDEVRASIALSLVRRDVRRARSLL